MKKNTSISTDALLKDGFHAYEAPFEAKAWEHMKSLLDEDDVKPVITVPPQTKFNNKTLLILTIMSILSIFSLATWMVLGSQHNISMLNSVNSVRTESGTNTQNTASATGRVKSGEKRTNTPSAFDKAFASNAIKQSESGVISVGKSGKQGESGALRVDENGRQRVSGSEGDETTLISAENPLYKDSVKLVSTNGKTYRVLVRKVWVPEEYQYIEKPRSKTVQDFWIGVHFTGQQPVNSDTMSAGFNLQFMSGNRLKNTSWGLYGGFDWGMQFYGHGQKTNVVLNNTSQDSGFTRLHTYSMDFLGRAHLEYARFPIIPYVNFAAGPRIYSTGQTVSSYLDLKETESSTSHNAHLSVSMMYGVGVGARVRVSKVVSLDARYELMRGTPVNIVDMNRSTFNGLSYDLKMDKVTPFVQQFKVGLIFDVSEGDYEKKLVKEGYYKEYMYDSLAVDPKDTNKIYLPCNCPCNTTEQHTSEYEQDNNNNNNATRRHNPIYTPSPSGSGSGRGSFPGIRPGGGGRPTEVPR